MADYMSAQIWIGGELPRQRVKTFLKVLNDQGALPEYGSASKWTEEDLKAVIQLGGPLLAVDDEAPWGQFDNVEAWCREHNLTYIRAHEAKYEWEAGVEWWQPGMEEPRLVTANQDGEPVVGLEMLRTLRSMEELQVLITSLTPPKVPPLVIK